ncbi:MAG: hypothetical protein H0Z39_11035 [Peptococcaceae bacterium]|nr:hypothetical protein [Peptococcaceae bacterium]
MKKLVPIVLLIALVLWGCETAISEEDAQQAAKGSLRYVPGIGMREIESPDFMSTAKPVAVESGDIRIDVEGLYFDGEETVLVYRAQGLGTSFFRDNTLCLVDNEAGKQYQGASGIISGNFKSAEGTCTFPPLQGAPTSMKLMIPDYPELSLDIPLVTADDLLTLEDVGQPIQVGDISLLAVPFCSDAECKVYLLDDFLEPGVRFVGFGNYRIDDKKLLPVLKDSQGRSYELRDTDHNMLVFEPVPRREKFTLEIPAITVTEMNDRAEIRVPVPEGEEPVPINKEVMLGSLPCTITSVQVVRDNTFGEHGLRINVEPGSKGRYTLLWFSWAVKTGAFGCRAPEKVPVGGVGRLNEDTGQMEFFQIDLKDLPKGKYVTLVLENPEVVVTGPWVFKDQINRIICGDRLFADGSKDAIKDKLALRSDVYAVTKQRMVYFAKHS